jgi:hypothetical protein
MNESYFGWDFIYICGMDFFDHKRLSKHLIN